MSPIFDEAFPAAKCEPVAPVLEEKPAKPKCVKRKADPALVTAPRDRRDRWLEQLNLLAAGEKRNVKITTALDLTIAEALGES